MDWVTEPQGWVAFLTLASQLSDITGGEDGLSFKVPEVLSPSFEFMQTPFLGVMLDGRVLCYYLLFVVAGVLLLAMLRIVNSPFGRVLQAIRSLKAHAGNDVPIIGVVMSPFSLPVMQLGLERYFHLLEQPELFGALMAINEEFCVEWANAQLEAGATAICYFDPVASPTVVPRDVYLRTGHPVARRTLARIKGPTATHLASGRALPILGDLAATGTGVVGVSALEDLGQLKAAARGKVTLLGNLNGIEMRRWTAQEA